MIFTAVQTLRSQTTSQEFKAYGANNLAPAVVSSSRIIAIPTDDTGLKRRMRLQQYLPELVERVSGRLPNGMELEGGSLLQGSAASAHHIFSEKLVSIPDAVAVIKDATESRTNKLEQAGYRKVTSGRYVYYQGPSIDENMKKVAQNGGEIFSFAPSEKVSIGGASAAFIIRRVLLYAFAATNRPFEGCVFPCGKDLPDLLITDLTAPIQFDPNSTLKGHFFPYFDGLVIPDKDIILTFLDIFARNLGATKEARKNVVSILLRGWVSLAFTSAGKKLSHMIYCQSIAIQGGFRNRPVYTRGEYVGMLFIGKGQVLKGAEVFDPVTADVLASEIASISGHDAAITEIAGLISSAPLRKGGNLVTVTGDRLDTPRKIHNELYVRKFDTATEVAISRRFPVLHFKQKFFEISDNANLVSVIDGFSKKTPLDPSAPCDYLGGHMFTTKKILSSLLAYGPVAPSPQISAGSNTVVRVSKSMHTLTHKVGILGGIPLFARPIQEAFEEWTALKKTGAIAFTSKGKDRNGRVKIRALARSVTVDDALSKSVLNSYVAFASKKRGQDETEDLPEETEKSRENKDQGRRKKKARMDTEAVGLFEGMGWSEPAGVQEDIDDEME